MDSLYSRYASALLSLALEEDKVLEYKNEVKMLKGLFLNNPDFERVLSSYFILDTEKEDIIDKVYNNNENVKNFIKIICKNKRINEIDKIFKEFIKSCNEVLKIKDGIIYSIKPLSEEEIKKIENGLTKKLGCGVELENVIDEKLIGGIKVMVEDMVFDGSIKNKLEKLKESLVSGGK